jgi:hypothetical protein
MSVCLSRPIPGPATGEPGAMARLSVCLEFVLVRHGAVSCRACVSVQQAPSGTSATRLRQSLAAAAGLAEPEAEACEAAQGGCHVDRWDGLTGRAG